MLRISYVELAGTLTRILLQVGFEREDAEECARLFTETTCDGVYTHGVNRFPRFLTMIQNGSVDVLAKPVSVLQCGALERWDGRRGPGNLNAQASMSRAMVLGREHGIGCVALANTNHWMRGGTYGWQAADAGMIGICWTNTLANLPAWGAKVPGVGNNPLVIAVPRPEGHVVLDMAMSQFSYGALAAYRKAGRPLPVEGGFDTEGRLTRDAGAIEDSQRPLPVGYWKGSGLALLLDMVAAMLSGGFATWQISTEPARETELSQVFIAVNLAAVESAESSGQIASQIIASLQSQESGSTVRYPGEQVLKTRVENLAKGIPVEPALWDELNAMLR